MREEYNIMNEIRPRNPWVALAMSLVLPGFGQLYNGELNKAIWLFLAVAFLSIPGIALVALYLPDGWMIPALVLSLLSALTLWLFGMVDAWRRAKAMLNYLPERWQVSGVYMLVLILCNIVALPLFTSYVGEHIVASYRIPTASMEPTVQRGDILFADKRYNCAGCKGSIHRGDIAIFTYPNNRTLLYIKRIIALPGDRVQIHNGDVMVNGKSLSAQTTEGATAKQIIETEDGRSWKIILEPDSVTVQNIDEVVPPGEVFVLGDNRAASADSRKFGTVPMQDVVGRARQVWLSVNAGSVHWNRMGTRLDE